ncbi:MAG: GHKL domain-containing protein [Rhodothermales bacterium]|nr:GHKL domain-containing protein [Rhodothermales bacterium]
MIYRHFRVQCILRIAVIAATITAAVVLAFTVRSYPAAILVGLLALYQTFWLISYVEKSNLDLARMLAAIRYSDFSQSFSGAQRGKSYQALSQEFRAIMDNFREERSEKETNFRYLQTVMQHVGVGLISYKADGTVNLINTAAKRLLRVPYLKNIDALKPLSSELVDTLRELRYGDKKLVQIVDEDELLQLVIHATEFKQGDVFYKLVTVQDIQSELDEKELEAWQKLTRVLTHEIMNSVAPISSLASTANELLQETDASDSAITHTHMEDVRGAVQTIERRSESLLNFVNDYRKLTRVPQPDLGIVRVSDLFEDLRRLFQHTLNEKGVDVQQSIVPPELEIAADGELIEQVLINLVTNAIQAVSESEKPWIQLEARIDRRGRAVIQVVDNGRGIVDEAIDKIFVPFFTTRKDGSGIGLSLSREIMRQHGGSIGVVSTPGTRTVFTLRF